MVLAHNWGINFYVFFGIFKFDFNLKKLDNPIKNLQLSWGLIMSEKINNPV